jgi:D-methionine transport system ATP-binding protein
MEPIISVEHLSKTYTAKNGNVEALKDISFQIDKGDIFGIIGLSGAGKSTLVRCLNLLEKPSEGQIIVNGQDMLSLSNKDLRQARVNIGMIFQHFNLLMQRTALENVQFSMEIAGVKKKESKKRAEEMLDKVGMADKKDFYPSQLSGGQKQRVAIARVLANQPEVLLCDEATSALDPQTTKSILDLLKEINKEYGITIVVITHSMSVVREICNRVAVLERGQLVETGTVKDIFENPKTEETRRLIVSSRAEGDNNNVG